MLGGIGGFPDVYALLGMAPPAYTGGALAPSTSRPANSEERLAGLRRLDAQAVRDQLHGGDLTDLNRLLDETDGALRLLAREKQATDDLPAALREPAQRMLERQELHLRGLQTLLAALMGEATGLSDRVGEALQWLQLRVGHKNVAEAWHEAACLAAAGGLPIRSPAGLDEALRLALCNLATQVHAVQQDLLERTRAALDTALANDHCLLKPPAIAGGRVQLGAMSRLGTHAEGLRHGLDLLQIRYGCDRMLSCYPARQADAVAPLASEAVPIGRLPSWLVDRPADALERLHLLSICRGALIDHAPTLHRGFVWVQAEIVLGELAEGRLLENAHVLTHVASNLLSGYAAALDAALGLREALGGEPPSELLALVDQSLLVSVDQMVCSGAAMRAQAGRAGVPAELWEALSAATVNIQARTAAWRTASSPVSDFAHTVGAFAPLHSTPPDATAQASDILKLDSPLLLAVPERPNG